MAAPHSSMEFLFPTSLGMTYCRVVGNVRADTCPLVVVHGGPGMTWDYLERLDGLAEYGIPIVYYDQIGSGKSRLKPHASEADVSLPIFVHQLGQLICDLGIEGRYALMGHSAGSMIALEHALLRPVGLQALIIGCGFAATAHMEESIRRRVAALPKELRSALNSGPGRSAKSLSAYQRAFAEFVRRHVCRNHSMPPELSRTFSWLGDHPGIFSRLWGSSIFELTGHYANWSVVERLNSIKVRSLVYRGEHDEAGEICMEPLAHELQNVQTTIFKNASHMPHTEAEQKCLEVLRKFLAANE